MNSLEQTPDFLSIEMMLKATPASEGSRRYVYLEASREAQDQDNEVVLAKALEESADHYLKFGNLDLDHKSMPSVAAKFGIERPELWEVGAPVDVRVDGKSTFVKAQLYTGDSPLAEKANMVWESMTALSPPQKWYPSVGGKVLAKSQTIDEKTGSRIGVVSKVRWTNIALSRHPVNQHVGGVATVPFGVLAKSWVSSGGFDLTKALVASHATDVASLSGGAALGMQSLDAGSAPSSYYDFREKLSAAIRSGAAGKMNAEALAHFSAGKFSLSLDEATEWVGRFLRDLKHGLTKRSPR